MSSRLSSGMVLAHCRASEELVWPSASRTAGDPLSDVLAQVKLSGALFFLIEATAPWGVDVPEAEAYSGVVLPGPQHVISYDIVLEGDGWVEMPGEEPVPFRAGDVLVFAHSQPHRLVSAVSPLILTNISSRCHCQCWNCRMRAMRRRRISAAKIGPNRFHQKRTLSWLTSMPRSCSMSSTFRRESGNRM
jgi:hypothetical protein